jgi:hypothetical protein
MTRENALGMIALARRSAERHLRPNIVAAVCDRMWQMYAEDTVTETIQLGFLAAELIALDSTR